MSANVLKRGTAVPTLKADRVETKDSVVQCAGAEYRMTADDATGWSFQSYQNGAGNAGILQLNKPQPGTSDNVLQFASGSQCDQWSIGAGAAASTPITVSGLSEVSSVVLITSYGTALGAEDATATRFWADLSVAGQITVRTDAAATASVSGSFFIARL